MKKIRGLYSLIIMAVLTLILFICVSKGWCTITSTTIDIQTIIAIESSGDPDAVNYSSGCIGLMQINPKGALADWNTYHQRHIHTESDLFNPEINVKIGAWYINERIPRMLRYYSIPDTTENRLIAYNWGIGSLRTYIIGQTQKLPKETEEYIQKYYRIKKYSGGGGG